MRTRLILAGLAVSALGLAGTLLLNARDPDGGGMAPRAPVAGPDVTPAQGADAWLDVNDPRPPALWLVRRTHRFSESSEDMRVEQVSALLTGAERAYHENRRMIANRVAQIVDVTGEHGTPLLPEKILADLALPEEVGRQWLGIVAQAYIELRRSGRAHDEAVQMVRQRVGEGVTRK
ncbi:hypothetical protein [Marinibacterium sp. SX1]|uniref:hypothetical protein n=1 Tax=Marinibacterium sp. SX1 TaxID=3388424 RepID=UPI003D17725F